MFGSTLEAEILVSELLLYKLSFVTEKKSVNFWGNFSFNVVAIMIDSSEKFSHKVLNFLFVCYWKAQLSNKNELKRIAIDKLKKIRITMCHPLNNICNIFALLAR